MADRDSDQPTSTSQPDISRRKFLKKAASYVPPAIIGVMATSRAAHAATCNPHACAPECNPNAGCGPDNNCGPDGCPPDAGGCGPEGCPPES